MPIMFSIVSRGTTVLARCANNCTGNFSEITEQVLVQIGQNDTKMTYSHGSFLFHFIVQNRITYLCISDNEFERSRAFLFLCDIHRKFQNSFGIHAQSALPYAMNTEFAKVLAVQMKHYSDSREIDQISQIQSEIDDLKDVMIKNIDCLASRGEQLELLVNKTENLNVASLTFRGRSQNLARMSFWKKFRSSILIFSITLVGIYCITTLSCGGFTWKKCI